MQRARAVLYELLVLAVAAIVSIPLYLIAINSFKSHADIVKHPLSFPSFEVGFDNIARAFDKMNIIQAYGVTFSIGLVTMLVIIVLGAFAAYAVARIKHPLFGTMYWVYTSAILIPIQSALIPIVFLLKDLHMSDTIIGISLIYSAMLSPFCIFMFSGFMRTLPYELEESAYLDGSSPARTFVRIIFPLVAPVTASLVIIQFIAVWNDLQLPLVVLNSNRHPTVSLNLLKFFNGRGLTDLSLLFGGIVLVLAPIMALFVSFQRFFIKGLSAGAVKG